MGLWNSSRIFIAPSSRKSFVIKKVISSGKLWDEKFKSSMHAKSKVQVIISEENEIVTQTSDMLTHTAQLTSLIIFNVQGHAELISESAIFIYHLACVISRKVIWVALRNIETVMTILDNLRRNGDSHCDCIRAMKLFAANGKPISNKLTFPNCDALLRTSVDIRMSRLTRIPNGSAMLLIWRFRLSESE